MDKRKEELSRLCGEHCSHNGENMTWWQVAFCEVRTSMKNETFIHLFLYHTVPKEVQGVCLK